ncbi:MAG: Rho termination factor N-terminal domain-containing protein [Promethearchaeota archaeon]
MTDYEHFMVYELDDSGERLKLNIEEAQLEESLHPEQVLVIVREDLRRIFIWKGGKSPVRKRFISSRVAQILQEELMKDSRYHRCKIVSVDAGDEPSEFLNAFGLESMVVTERLADMRYIRNIERERMEQATITDVSPKTTTLQSEDEYFSPALQDTSNKIVVSSYARTVSSPKVGTYKQPMVQPSTMSKAIGLSDEQKQIIKNKILKTDVSNGYKRLNLILGHSLYAAVSKTAEVFGKEVEETDWEPVKKVPKDMLELDHHVLRVYFDEKKGIVEAVEVLEKEDNSKNKTKAKETDSSREKVDFNSMTVKDLKAFAEENKIELPSSAKKAEIIEILEQANQKKSSGLRQLPKIPNNDD